MKIRISRERVYDMLPASLQSALCSAEGWRLNRMRYDDAFDRALAAYEGRASWSQDRIAEYRDRRVASFIAHALANVPHYRTLARELGVAPGDVKGLDDLAQLPILTKDEVQRDPDQFSPEGDAEKGVVIAHTSGTTGGGLRFATTRGAIQEQWATWWRYRGWHGITRATWCGYFGGRSVVPVDDDHPPYWRYNRPGKQILFSGYHLSPATARSYVEELRRRRPPWLHGYPSMLALFARFVMDQQLDLGYQLEWVTLGAENLLDSQRDAIARAFGVVPIQNYGMAEAVANASQCPAGKLHLDEDFAAVETVPGDDESYRKVVGTNFTNPAFPLIRYEVGDLATESDDRCDCGRPGRLLSNVDGRREDFVVLKSGARVGRLDHVFKDMVHVREAQFVQREPGGVTVRVVKGERFVEEDEARLVEELEQRLGSDMTIRLDYVDKIPRTASGKLRLVVSELAEGRLTR